MVLNKINNIKVNAIYCKLPGYPALPKIKKIAVTDKMDNINGPFYLYNITNIKLLWFLNN